MDPLNAKLVQLFVAQGVGVLMLLGGVILSLLNLAGRMHLIFQGPGFRVKMQNATPGILIAVVGLILVWRSLDSTIERVETITINPAPLQGSNQGNSQDAPVTTTQTTHTRVILHHYVPWGKKLQVPYDATDKLQGKKLQAPYDGTDKSSHPADE
jgi:hypothetical protein